MANLVFLPIEAEIKSGTYLLDDCACGTGGMLTVAEETLTTIASKRREQVRSLLYGREINPETYAVCKADMLLKGEGENADHIVGGAKWSTLAHDAFPAREFDFMLANPPYGKSWKKDLEAMGGKDGMRDPRFKVIDGGRAAGWSAGGGGVMGSHGQGCETYALQYPPILKAAFTMEAECAHGKGCRHHFDLRAIGQAVGRALLPGGQEGGDLAAPLLRPELDDPLRLHLLEQALALRPLLLVLDDFEQNLSPGGEAFLDPDTARWLDTLVAAAGRGRLLLTCRHPLPGGWSGLLEVPLGPLSGAETRKLLQRLPGLRRLPEAEVAVALRAIGGHPRLLECLDALLSQGEGRLPAVTRRLRLLLAEAGLALDAAPAPLEERLSQALALGARDVLLEELLAIARQRGDDGVLLQLAVSNLPLAPEGLAQMLAGVVEAAALGPALERLAAPSLVVRLGEGQVWVHRWTAEGLARGTEPEELAERCRRAGDYRLWRVENETGDLADGIEAVRNYLRGGQLDQAAAVGQGCLAALARFGQTIGCGLPRPRLACPNTPRNGNGWDDA